MKLKVLTNGIVLSGFQSGKICGTS